MNFYFKKVKFTIQHLTPSIHDSYIFVVPFPYLVLFEKIDYFYIITLSLATESFLKSIYDIKMKQAISQFIYNREINEKLRYLAFNN